MWCQLFKPFSPLNWRKLLEQACSHLYFATNPDQPLTGGMVWFSLRLLSYIMLTFWTFLDRDLRNKLNLQNCCNPGTVRPRAVQKSSNSQELFWLFWSCPGAWLDSNKHCIINAQRTAGQLTRDPPQPHVLPENLIYIPPGHLLL